MRFFRKFPSTESKTLQLQSQPHKSCEQSKLNWGKFNWQISVEITPFRYVADIFTTCRWSNKASCVGKVPVKALLEISMTSNWLNKPISVAMLPVKRLPFTSKIYRLESKPISEGKLPVSMLSRNCTSWREFDSLSKPLGSFPLSLLWDKYICETTFRSVRDFGIVPVSSWIWRKGHC